MKKLPKMLTNRFLQKLIHELFSVGSKRSPKILATSVFFKKF
jgi:hypothetical protein